MTAIRIRFGAAHADITAPGHDPHDLEPEYEMQRGGRVRPRRGNSLSDIASWVCKARRIGPTEMPKLSVGVTLAAAMPARLLSV